LDFWIIVGHWIDITIKWINIGVLVQINLLLWTRSGLGGAYGGLVKECFKLTMAYGVLCRQSFTYTPKGHIQKLSLDKGPLIHASLCEKDEKRNVCCYIYHVELDELQKNLNYMCTSSGIHSQSQCDYDYEEICASIDGTKGCDACMGSSTT
jgi:hypothetical protein